MYIFIDDLHCKPGDLKVEVYELKTQVAKDEQEDFQVVEAEGISSCGTCTAASGGKIWEFRLFGLISASPVNREFATQSLTRIRT